MDPLLLPRSNRGSLLIVALLLSAMIGISLVSYMHLARTSLTISNRALYNNAAMNVAENGLEEAMYSINRTIADPNYTWPRWTNNGTAADSAAWREFRNFRFDQNTTGAVRVYVYNYRGQIAPKIVARSRITMGGTTSAPIEKWIEVTLRKTSKFANGLVAKNSIVFNGTNTSVDSWNSAPLPPPAAPVQYSAAARRDNGSVGSISVAVDSVLVKQADIWGFVSTNSSDPTTTVGTGGSILGASSVFDPATWTSANVDPARVSTDFSASFDPVTAPAKTYIADLGEIKNDTVLPLAADVAAGRVDADGNYYYSASKINLTNKYLHITGKVVLKLSETGNYAIDVGGGSGIIQVRTGGTLAVYTAGNVKIAGQGAVNGVDANGDGKVDDAEAQQPINFQIWGTKTTGAQDFDIVGQGTLSSIIYAPQGDVKITGGGSISGSVVANNITLSGTANFHYDESLGNFGGGNPFRVSLWKELTTAAARTAYSSQVGVLNYPDEDDET
jgi:hypothetical protein